MAGAVVDVLAIRGAPRVRPRVGRRVDRDPRPLPAGAGVPDPGRVRRRDPGQGPVQRPPVDGVVLRDPGPGLGPVHQRRQHLREQGEQSLVIEPTGSQSVIERPVAPAELRLQGQVHQRLHRAAGAQDGVRQVEQGIAPRRQAPAQPFPELPQRLGRRDPRGNWHPGTGTWQAGRHGRFLSLFGCVATPRVKETAAPHTTIRYMRDNAICNLIRVEIKLKVKLGDGPTYCALLSFLAASRAPQAGHRRL